MGPVSRCLSVRQPWTWAICLGEKRIENRTWRTDYRGTIAIHASASKQTVNAIRKANKDSPFDATFFTYGAIIGVVDVVDCVEVNPVLENDPWAQGTICWRLENARFIAEPVLMKGKLNLFKLSDEIAANLDRQLAMSPPATDNTLAKTMLGVVCPSRLEACIDQAVSYLELRKPDDVVRLSSKAIELDASNGHAYQLRSAGRYDLERFEDALADASRAIELNPKLFGAPLQPSFGQRRAW